MVTNVVTYRWCHQRKECCLNAANVALAVAHAGVATHLAPPPRPAGPPDPLRWPLRTGPSGGPLRHPGGPQGRPHRRYPRSVPPEGPGPAGRRGPVPDPPFTPSHRTSHPRPSHGVTRRTRTVRDYRPCSHPGRPSPTPTTAAAPGGHCPGPGASSTPPRTPSGG